MCASLAGRRRCFVIRNRAEKRQRVWGRKRRGDPGSVEDRYRAVVRLLLRRGFDPQGLTLIEVDGGFVVRGLRDLNSHSTVVSNDTISADEVLAELEHLGR
jgi:hypothetical protein